MRDIPVEQVFELFTDIQHGAEHVSNIQKIELLTPGVFELATRWLETREVLGQFPFRFEVSLSGFCGEISRQENISILQIREVI